MTVLDAPNRNGTKLVPEEVRIEEREASSQCLAIGLILVPLAPKRWLTYCRGVDQVTRADHLLVEGLLAEGLLGAGVECMWSRSGPSNIWGNLLELIV